MIIADVSKDEHFFPGIDQVTGYTTRNMLAVPVCDEEGAIRGVLQVLNRKEGTFSAKDQELLAELAEQVAEALERTSMRPCGDRSRGLLMDGPFNNIIGEAPQMQELYQRILAAATTDATVLMRGDSGTGKTLVARAVHDNSARNAGPLIHVDCTTLPAGLIESELFGHERGAFTGADRRVQGKFELAAGGTLFLDEIGDLPLPLQGKLLRFLQERRVRAPRRPQDPARRRAGRSRPPTRTWSRRSLRGAFRRDLYYRMRVVELTVPPLRERGPRDIAAAGRALPRRLRPPPPQPGPGASRLTALARLQRHDWPGNVRELEHCIESAVVLCPGRGDREPSTSPCRATARLSGPTVGYTPGTPLRRGGAGPHPAHPGALRRQPQRGGAAAGHRAQHAAAQAQGRRLTARSAPPFTPLTSLLAGHARVQPAAPALMAPGMRRAWGELVDRVGRLAGALRRRGLQPGDAVAVDGALSSDAVERYLAVLWAGGCPVPLPVHVTDAARAGMRRDCGARSGQCDLSDLSAAPVPPYPARPDEAFNILYSSGTTAAPKGIVQEHRMRAFQIARMQRLGLGPGARTALATPLCSNTTLIALLPSLAAGGAIVLPEGGRFDAEAFIGRAVATEATACMLVPVQLRRLLAHLDGGGGRPPAMLKLCTGAPLGVDDKRALVARWPGPLVEIYGQTEGGATTVLRATEQPERLHTVGCPAAGVDLRVLGPEGGELPAGETGEIVGRSEGMMRGYHGRPELTKALTWRDGRGRAFYRTGDLGRLDEGGFLELRGRSEEVIISGGYNVFAADLERVLLERPEVLEAAVIGVPSRRWGETPLGLVLLRPGAELDGDALRAWANERLGAAQRLARVLGVAALPRNGAGKVIKRELKERYGGRPESQESSPEG